MLDDHVITNVTELRECYPQQPHERARRKTLHALDHHMRNFIARSPFLCMGTSSDQGADVTPRGDQPGFVHVLDDATNASRTRRHHDDPICEKRRFEHVAERTVAARVPM